MQRLLSDGYLKSPAMFQRFQIIGNSQGKFFNMLRADFLKGLKFRGNIYGALALRLLLAMFLFSLCRVGFYFFNASFFPDIAPAYFLRILVGGIRFDLVSVLYTNSLIILMMILPFDFRFHRVYEKIVRILFYVINGVMLAINVSDFIYYRFTLRRTTMDVFKQFENENNMAGLWMRFLVDYWYAVLFWIALMAIMILLYRRITVQGPQLKNRLSYYISGVLAMLLTVYLVIGGMRGGFRHSTRPITLSNAGEYVTNARDISLVLNTPFTLMRTIGKTKVQKAKYFADEQELERVFTPVHTPGDTAAFKPQNVVVIILESFSREFVGAFNRDKDNGQYKGYTPFLDSLIGQSLTFENSFANGRKSIDGLPSVISSIPSLGTPYFLSPYSGDKINSLGSLLGNKGYHTSFFHGAPNGSMGFQAFMNLAGVKNYFGKSEYNNDKDFDNIWGIWDDKFLQFFAETTNSFPQPFMTSFFSLSSHHPFKVPEEFEGKFKGGPLVIHACIEYTDYALKKYFEKVSTMPWYKNTLFVITADHTSSEIQFDEYRTAWGLYSIPIIFFKPDNSLKGRSEAMAQQIDIMPSILGYLHYDKPYVAFGRNVFDSTSTGYAFNFYNENTYQLFKDDFLFQFDGQRATGLFNFRTDKLLKENLLSQRPDLLPSLELSTKAFIQQYNNRLIDNKLVVE